MEKIEAVRALNLLENTSMEHKRQTHDIMLFVSTQLVLNYKIFDFINIKFDHSSYSKKKLYKISLILSWLDLLIKNFQE